MALIRLSIVFGRGLNYRMISIDFRMNDERVSVYIDDTLKSSHSYVRYNMHTISCKMDDRNFKYCDEYTKYASLDTNEISSEEY